PDVEVSRRVDFCHRRAAKDELQLRGGPAMDDRKNRRVLVVDDDQQCLEAMRTMLEEHGYDVVTARDGSEGLMRAECESPDLVVLDVMMPRRSGFGVLDHIGGRGTNGPRIVVITANEEE